MTFARLTFSVLVLLAIAYVVFGALHDFRAWYVDRRLAAARRALAVVLFEDEQRAAAAFPVVRRLPDAWLLDLAQSVAADLGDSAHEQLERVAVLAGAARRVRWLARRRSWYRRAQAGRLSHLLADRDVLRQRLLADPHPLVRASVAESLDARDVGPRAWALLTLLGDPSRAARIAAQQALLRGDSRIVPPLAAYINGPERPGTDLALEIAANRSEPKLVQATLRHARDLDPARRALVARAIATAKVPSAERVLVGLLADEHSVVRAAAVRAVGVVRLTGLANRIGQMLGDESWAVRREAGLALDELGPSGTVVLRAHLFDRDRYARDMARQVLDAAATRRRLPMVLMPESLRGVPEVGEEVGS